MKWEKIKGHTSLGAVFCAMQSAKKGPSPKCGPARATNNPGCSNTEILPGHVSIAKMGGACRDVEGTVAATIEALRLNEKDCKGLTSVSVNLYGDKAMYI